MCRPRSCAVGIAIAQVTVSACQVPDKLQFITDGGSDAPGDSAKDGAPPETAIDEAPGALTRERSTAFRFSSNDPDSTFDCRLDDAPAAPCQSPHLLTLEDGPHAFSVRATDAAGNFDPTPAEWVWTIDTLAPETMLIRGPSPLDNSVQVRFEFRSDDPNASFECSLDNQAYAECRSGDTFGPLTDGPHAFAVRAKDRAGNLDISPALYAWSVDTRTPDTQILAGPSGPTRSNSATFSFSSPDAGTGAVFECSLDRAGFSSCSSPRTYTGLAEGEHVFEVRVKDRVGNVDPTPAIRTWRVDTDPPETSITSGPSGTVPIASASFAFVADELGASFSCSLDKGAFSACSSPHVVTGLAQGAHSFAVLATDAAGNADATPATRSWTVDTVPPVVTIVDGPLAGSTSGPRVRFGFTISGGTADCNFDGGAWFACASPVATNLRAGPHTFTLRGTDPAGNVATTSRSWTVVCQAPSTTGAAGLLHFDDAAQTQANAVMGGAPAMLGTTLLVETEDPVAVATARFGGGFWLVADQSDRVTWPAALPAVGQLTIELWASPDSLSGTRDLVVTGDQRIALRVRAATSTTVQISMTIAEDLARTHTRTVTSASVAAAMWHHVIASFRAPTVRLWVDGVAYEMGGTKLDASLALDAIRIGGIGAMAYGGQIDELWLSSTAITDSEAARTRYCPL